MAVDVFSQVLDAILQLLHCTGVILRRVYLPRDRFDNRENGSNEGYSAS